MIWYYWLVVATVLVNCINRNTHDGNEYAKCLVSGTSYNGMNEIGSVTYKRKPTIHCVITTAFLQ
jgi:hypothetical protein